MNYIKRNSIPFISFIIIFMFFVCGANAQHRIGLPPEVMAWTISTMEPWPPGRYKSLKEAIIDNKFTTPLVFRGGMFPKLDTSFHRDSLKINDHYHIPSALEYKSRRIRPMFRHYTFDKRLEDMVYKEVLLKNPDYFHYAQRQLPTTVVKPESIDISHTPIKFEVKTTIAPPETVDSVIKFIPDRRYWTSTFSSDIKFSQNRSSANWYNGEINNMNIYTNAIITYNYKKDKVSVTNTLSTTFTIVNAPSDTLRKYTIGSNELRYRSNFGYKAVRNWNYSSSIEFITPLGNKYETNSETKNSAFLSPFTLNVGVGMTYAVKPKFKKKNRALDLSLSIEPFSLKYMYSKDKNINLAAYFEKNEDGSRKHTLRTLGSTITMTKNTKFSKSVSWYSRLNYFTNYERAIGEFENKLDIALSRFFSTTFYLYLRYDDGVTRPEGSDSYLQVNEMFSFGFSYKW